MPFEQKVVVITGALRGIGASLVERFRKIGYGVVANSRSIDAAGDPAVLVVDGDIAGRDTAERVVNVERFGRIDTLINNAGVFIPKQFIDYSETDFATMIAVNLGGSSTSRRRQQPGCFGRVPATSSMSRRRVWLGRRCIRARCTSSSQVYSPWAEWIVDTVLYCEKAAFVTGEILHVDGGWSAGRGLGGAHVAEPEPD